MHDDIECGCDRCHGYPTISAGSMGQVPIGRDRTKPKPRRKPRY